MVTTIGFAEVCYEVWDSNEGDVTECYCTAPSAPRLSRVWQKIVAFGSDDAHRVGGHAFREAAAEQELIASHLATCDAEADAAQVVEVFVRDGLDGASDRRRDPPAGPGEEHPAISRARPVTGKAEGATAAAVPLADASSGSYHGSCRHGVPYAQPCATCIHGY